MDNDHGYIFDMFSLKNRVVILTGGMGRLGTEFAEVLLKASGRVVILDVIDSPNNRLKKLAENYPLIFRKIDITKEGEVERTITEIKDLWATPTILINNAGWRASPNKISKGGVPFEEYPIDTWEEVFKTNLTGAVISSKVVGGQMIKNKKKGVIINIGSIYGLVAPNQSIYKYKRTGNTVPFIKDASYSSSKAALMALTRDLAVQWASYGIRVVALSPGGIQNNESNPDFVKAYSAKTPLGRMSKAEEYCGAILFLASDASSYMTGMNLIIDGGWTIW